MVSDKTIHRDFRIHKTINKTHNYSLSLINQIILPFWNELDDLYDIPQTFLILNAM